MSRTMTRGVLLMIFLVSEVSSECQFFNECSDFTVNREHAYVGQSLVFNCTVTDRDTNIHDVKIQAKNSSSSHGWDLPVMVLNNQTIQAIVPHADLHNTGSYYCYRGAWDKLADISLGLHVTVEEVPLPPENFTCTSINLNQIRCSWDEKQKCRLEPCWNISYNYNTYDGDKECSNSTDVRAGHSKPTCRVHNNRAVCDGVVSSDDNIEHQLYHFYLAADRVYSYTICYNYSIVTLSLRSLRVDAMSSSKINVSWCIMMTGFDKGITCRIEYHASDFNNSSFKILHYNSSDVSQNKNYTLDNLHPYTEYNVTVTCSVTGGLFSGEPLSKSNRTNPSAPLIGPLTTNTSFYKCGKRCKILYLEKPPPYLAQGVISGYIIEQHGVNSSIKWEPSIKIYSDTVKIWLVNSKGISAKATSLILNSGENDYIEIENVMVQSPENNYVVTCNLKNWDESNTQYIFHRCTGNFAVDKQCMGNYTFYTSRRNKMTFSDARYNDTFGVSVAAPLQSQGIKWLDSETYSWSVEKETKVSMDFIPGIVVAVIVICTIFAALVVRKVRNKCNPSTLDDIEYPRINQKSETTCNVRKASIGDESSNGTQTTDVTTGSSASLLDNPTYTKVDTNEGSADWAQIIDPLKSTPVVLLQMDDNVSNVIKKATKVENPRGNYPKKETEMLEGRNGEESENYLSVNYSRVNSEVSSESYPSCNTSAPHISNENRNDNIQKAKTPDCLDVEDTNIETENYSRVTLINTGTTSIQGYDLSDTTCSSYVKETAMVEAIPANNDSVDISEFVQATKISLPPNHDVTRSTYLGSTENVLSEMKLSLFHNPQYVLSLQNENHSESLLQKVFQNQTDGQLGPVARTGHSYQSKNNGSNSLKSENIVPNSLILEDSGHAKEENITASNFLGPNSTKDRSQVSVSDQCAFHVEHTSGSNKCKTVPSNIESYVTVPLTNGADGDLAIANQNSLVNKQKPGEKLFGSHSGYVLVAYPGLHNEQMFIANSSGSHNDQISIANSSGSHNDQISIGNSSGSHNDQISIANSSGSCDEQIYTTNLSGSHNDEVSIANSSGSHKDQISIANSSGSHNHQISIANSFCSCDEQIYTANSSGSHNDEAFIAISSGSHNDQISIASSSGSRNDQMSIAKTSGSCDEQIYTPN